MLRSFWALLAALRVCLVLAAQRPFSVSDDLLAYPQFQIQWLDDYVTDDFAEEKLHHANDGQSRSPQHSHIEPYDPPPIAEPGHESTNSASSEADHQHDYELMVVQKQRFLCAIPRIAASEEDEDAERSSYNETTLAQQREEEQKELSRANERGWELLSGMQGHCVYYVSGWWSYSFCFQQGVRQFHALAPARGLPVYPPQEDTSVEGYVLGQYDVLANEQPAGEMGVSRKQDGSPSRKETAPTGELVAKGDSRYLVQKLDGGTVCDLTGKGRRVEIQVR